MEILDLVLFSLMSGLIGAVSMLLIQYVIYVKFFTDPQLAKRDTKFNSTVEEYVIPESLMCNIQSADPVTKNSMTAFNLICQFLFYELRYSSRVRNWYYRKLTKEMEQLIEKTSLGKFFEKLLIRELDFGTEFPEIRNLRVHNVDLHETEGNIDTLDLVMDLTYKGNYKLTIDGIMTLGKKVLFSVKVKHLSGLCRVQFTRKPFTHWSLAFIGDPKLDMDIETKFNSPFLNLHPNLQGLMSNQIRRAIRRKHTLPIYKIRYKPFFRKGPLEVEIPDIEPRGELVVTTCEFTRLKFNGPINQVFCTLTVSPIPWINAKQQNSQFLAVTLEVIIHRAKNQQIGIIFKQCESNVIIEAILPNTPATKANILPGDTLLFIENKSVSNINQITKIIKGLTTTEVTLRLERMITGLISSDREESKITYAVDFSNIKFSKDTDTVQIGSKSPGKLSQEQLAQSESNTAPNTPSNSPKKNLLSSPNSNLAESKLSPNNVLSTTPSNASNTSAESEADREEFVIHDEVMSMPTHRLSINVETLQQHVTEDVTPNLIVRFGDVSRFPLNARSHWLNLCVFGRCTNSVVMLGYANISVASVIVDCDEASLHHLTQTFPLSPPEPYNHSSHPLSNLSGFEPSLCFGDVLMQFAWIDEKKEIKRTPTTTSKSKEAQDSPLTLVGQANQHDFVRTHFQRSTQCDYCGKKIWLKDAVQCRKCNMSCHKKCVKKCQTSTVCAMPASEQAMPSYPVSTNQAPLIQWEIAEEELKSQPSAELQQRSSFTNLMAQNIKRVNSANNLSIPGTGAPANQSRSLPPSPHQSPRKQSLANLSANPFVAVVQKLEQLPSVTEDYTEEQICTLTEPLIEWGRTDELLALAKTASRSLYADINANDRVDRINELLVRLRAAMDYETLYNASLSPNVSPEHQLEAVAETENNSDGTSIKRKLSVPNTTDAARRAFLIGQSDERIHALSAVMLYLCTGLQYAQGVATN